MSAYRDLIDVDDDTLLAMNIDIANEIWRRRLDEIAARPVGRPLNVELEEYRQRDLNALHGRYGRLSIGHKDKKADAAEPQEKSA